MRAHLAGLAFALIIGSESAAAVAALEGLVFWNNIALLMDLLWVAAGAGLLAGAMAWRHAVRCEHRLAEEAVLEGRSMDHPAA